MTTDLHIQFHQDMVNALQACIRELHYNPTIISYHMSKHGSVETAHWAINLPGETSGFTKLWMAHRLDLSIEALVLKPQYAPLFSVEDRRIAYDTLTQYHYTFPPGITRP